MAAASPRQESSRPGPRAHLQGVWYICGAGLHPPLLAVVGAAGAGVPVPRPAAPLVAVAQQLRPRQERPGRTGTAVTRALPLRPRAETHSAMDSRTQFSSIPRTGLVPPVRAGLPPRPPPRPRTPPQLRLPLCQALLTGGTKTPALLRSRARPCIVEMSWLLGNKYRSVQELRSNSMLFRNFKLR